MKNVILFFLVVFVLCFAVNIKQYNAEAIGIRVKKEIKEIKETNAVAENSSITHFIYFTGIGCPHCAKIDPILLKYQPRLSNIMIIEYEIYQSRINAPLLLQYDKKYHSGFGVPLLIESKKNVFMGDEAIIENLKNILDKGNNIPLINGEPSFMMLNLQALQGLPKIWYKNRIAIKKEKSNASEEIKQFLLNGITPEGAKNIKPKSVALSGDKVKFKNAVSYDGWLLMWD